MGRSYVMLSAVDRDSHQRLLQGITDRTIKGTEPQMMELFFLYTIDLNLFKVFLTLGTCV